MMKTKIALEDSFYALAEASGEPSVIICDRGTMDTAGMLYLINFLFIYLLFIFFFVCYN